MDNECLDPFSSSEGFSLESNTEGTGLGRTFKAQLVQALSIIECIALGGTFKAVLVQALRIIEGSGLGERLWPEGTFKAHLVQAL